MCQQIIEACKQQDSEKLKSLFSEESKKNIENLDTEISAFFDYIEGSIQRFEGDCASSSESNYGKRKTELDGMYLILTEKERYSYAEGYVTEQSHGGADISSERRSVFLYDKVKDDEIEITVFSRYIDKNTYLKVQYLPHTKYGAIVEIK